jgi:urea transporter
MAKAATMQTTWNTWSSHVIVKFVDEVLRGIGQVMFQNSPLTGLLFLIGLFGGGWEFGVYALLGTGVSTLMAHWLGVQPGLIGVGLYGYNGTLVGVGLAFYLKNEGLLPLYVILAAAVVAVFSAAISNLLGTWKVPALTAPFVATTVIFLLGIYGFGELKSSPNMPAPTFPGPGTGRESMDFSTLWHGFFNGVAEVFFQDKVWIGIIFLAGILVSSHIDFVMAMVGSTVGIGIAWALGTTNSSIDIGLHGYNPVLTMMALGGLFYLLAIDSFLFSLIAAATATVVAVALGAIVAPIGSPIFTAPFVLTTWVFIAASPLFTRLQAVAPAEATTPEGNLNLFRRTGHWWQHYL